MMAKLRIDKDVLIGLLFGDSADDVSDIEVINDCEDHVIFAIYGSHVPDVDEVRCVVFQDFKDGQYNMICEFESIDPIPVPPRD